jgi:hypothetical protein
LVVLGLAILFLRRPDQFLHPYVWDEEGKWILKEYVADGWRSLLYPLAGYFIFISRAIVLSGFSLSILDAPQINAVLTFAFTLIVAIAVANSPTALRWRWLCAVSMLLVPSDPEVFGVALYAFWWAGILVLLAVLWRPNARWQWIRNLFLVVGGLSSPLIVPAAALLILRALWERNRWAILAAGVGAAAAVVQGKILYTQVHAPVLALFSGTYYLALIQKYVGSFFYHAASVGLGIAALCVLVMIAAGARKALTWDFLLLVVVFVVVSVSVSMRMPGGQLGGLTNNTGPRYFFYSYVTLGWILIWLAAASGLRMRAVIGLLFVVSMVTSAPFLSRRHDPIDWRQNIITCADSSGQFDLPIHYAGSASDMWKLQINGSDCKRLMDQSLF